MTKESKFQNRTSRSFRQGAYISARSLAPPHYLTAASCLSRVHFCAHAGRQLLLSSLTRRAFAACSSWSTASGLLRCRFATSTASLTAVVSTVAFSAASFSATSFSASAHRATAHAKPLPCSHACQAVLCVKALAVRAASPSEPCAVHSSVQSLAVCPMCGWCDVCPALRWHGARRCATFKCAMLETAVLYHTSF